MVKVCFVLLLRGVAPRAGASYNLRDRVSGNVASFPPKHFRDTQP